MNAGSSQATIPSTCSRPREDAAAWWSPTRARRWFRPRLRAQIVAAFGLVVAMGAVRSFLAISTLAQVDAEYSTLLARQHGLIQEAARFERDAEREINASGSYVFTGDVQFLDQRREAGIDKEQALARIREGGIAEPTFVRLQEAAMRHERLADSLIALRQSNRSAETVSLLHAEVESARRQLAGETQRLVDGYEQALIAKGDRIAAEVQNLIRLHVALLGVVVVIGLGFALGFSRSITGSAERLLRHVRSITDGDLATPVVIRRIDEIGELAAGIEEMRLALARGAEEQTRLLAEARFQANKAEETARRALDHAESLRVALAREQGLTAWLSELDRLRADFVSMVSHELKSPLLAVHNYATILLHHSAGLDQAGQRELMEIVERESRRLVRLVDDILTTSRIESGQLSYEFGPVYLLGLVEEIVAEQQVLAADYQLSIRLVGPPPTARADEGRVRQVLLNLIDNAVKYSPAGSRVTVTIEALPGAREVGVHVQDEGVGIAAEDISQLFGKFRRLGNQPDVSGTGLGLYISRMIVEGHGGRIWAESTPGAGSTFSFTLPLEEARALGS